MTRAQGFRRPIERRWRSAWPLWALLLFVGLAAVRWLPGGYVRAAVAAPILLVVPGTLTLGAIFSARRGPRGAAFACYAVLLSVIWSAFASLILYGLGVLITAASTYWCLLLVSAALAIVAQARLRRGPPDAGSRPATGEAGRYGVVTAAMAVVGGVSLLAGGVYAEDHLPHPAPVGYTWIAWTGPRVQSALAVGPAGRDLPFQIVHRQPGTTTFRLAAAWPGVPPRLLAGPLTVRIGPGRTFRGRVFVPPLPDGCTYRITVTLTAARPVDPLTGKPRSWSINADVRAPGRPLKACR